MLHINGFTLAGRDESYSPAVTQVFAEYPGLGLAVHELVLNGDRLCMRFSEHAAAADHDDRLTAWRGIGLYRWNGRRLIENWVEQDYASRDRQLATGEPNPLDRPHLDPWVTTAARRRGRRRGRGGPGVPRPPAISPPPAARWSSTTATRPAPSSGSSTSSASRSTTCSRPGPGWRSTSRCTGPTAAAWRVSTRRPVGTPVDAPRGGRGERRRRRGARRPRGQRQARHRAAARRALRDERGGVTC